MFLQTTANKTHKNPKTFIKSVAYQENLKLIIVISWTIGIAIFSLHGNK